MKSRRITVGKEPYTDRKLTEHDMNPRSLKLYVGQILNVSFTDEKSGNRRKGFIQIKKLFEHHALCKVNGKFNECYTYNELSTMVAVREGLKDA